MARARIKPPRWIRRFMTHQPDTLREQLATLERSIYDALSGAGAAVGNVINAVVSKGLGTIGDSELAAPVNHEHPLPFYVVATYADLQKLCPAVSGVHTLLTGLWLWLDEIDLDGNVIDLPTGTHVRFVQAHGQAGVTTSSASPCITINTGVFFDGPMRCGNTGAGLGLHLTGVVFFLAGWTIANGNVRVDGTTQLDRCFVTHDIVYNSGTELHIHNTWFRQILLSNTAAGAHDRLVVIGGEQGFGESAAMVEVPNGIEIVGGIHLYSCRAASKMLLLGTGINGTSPARTPTVEIIGGSGTQIDVATIPTGGLIIDGVVLSHATPFVGFDRFTAGVVIREPAGPTGLALETPNGHQWYNSAGTLIDQKRKAKALSGLTVVNNGDTTEFNAVDQVSFGNADEVLTTNAAGNARQWRKAVNANIATNAEIEVSKLQDGAANELVKTNSAGTGVEWGLLKNANVATDAAIEVDKLEVGNNKEVLYTNGSNNIWTTRPITASHRADEFFDLMAFDTADVVAHLGTEQIALTCSDETNGLTVVHDEDDYRHELTSKGSSLAGMMTRHVERTYEFSRTGGSSGPYPFYTASYEAPFGWEHGTSDLVIISGRISIQTLTEASGAGAWIQDFWFSWRAGGTSPLIAYNTQVVGGGSAEPYINSDDCSFGITPPGSDIFYNARLSVDIAVGTP